MSAWVNGTIPDISSTYDMLTLKIKLLETELSFVRAKLDNTINEFENVYESVKKHGYINLTYGKETIVLIEKKDTANKEGEEC